MTEETAARLDSMERSHRRLKLLVGLLILVLTGGGATAAAWQMTGNPEPTDRVIRARRVAIVDDSGVVRARLGADLPDAVVHGDTIARGTQAAGLMLYDKTGTERGGYVTLDSNNNVLLTLDAADEEGGYRQTAFFLAEPNGATALRIWSGDDLVEMRAGADDGARFNAVRDGKLVFQTPDLSTTERKSMCEELRKLLQKVDKNRLMASCRQRMSEEACRSCLEQGGL